MSPVFAFSLLPGFWSICIQIQHDSSEPVGPKHLYTARHEAECYEQNRSWPGVAMSERSLVHKGLQDKVGCDPRKILPAPKLLQHAGKNRQPCKFKAWIG